MTVSSSCEMSAQPTSNDVRVASVTLPLPDWMFEPLHKAKSGGCEATAAQCLCRFKAGHKSKTHRCVCGGVWTGTEPDYTPIKFPGGLSLSEAHTKVLGGEW